LSNPLASQVLISNDEDLMDAMDKFQEAFDAAQTAVISDAPETLQELEEPPQYKATLVSDSQAEGQRIRLDIPEDFAFQDAYEDLVQESGIICIKLSLW
jgi:hypothetical protein